MALRTESELPSESLSKKHEDDDDEDDGDDEEAHRHLEKNLLESANIVDFGNHGGRFSEKRRRACSLDESLELPADDGASGERIAAGVHDDGQRLSRERCLIDLHRLSFG